LKRSENGTDNNRVDRVGSPVPDKNIFSVTVKLSGYQRQECFIAILPTEV